MPKPDAIMAMLGDDPVSVENLIDAIDKRHKYASAADRSVAAYSRSRGGEGLMELICTRRNDADGVLSARAICKRDPIAAALWLYGFERCWWLAHPDIVERIEATRGEPSPRPVVEAKPMKPTQPSRPKPSAGTAREMAIAGQLVERLLADPDIETTGRLAVIHHWFDLLTAHGFGDFVRNQVAATVRKMNWLPVLRSAWATANDVHAAEAERYEAALVAREIMRAHQHGMIDLFAKGAMQ